MTVEELHDEISAIDAIYPDSTSEVAPQIYNLKIPQHDGLEIQMSFLESYPDEIPNVIQILNNNTRIYTDTNYLETQVKETLSNIFRKGEVCIFELFTELEAILEKYIGKEVENDLQKDMGELKISEVSTEEKNELDNNNNQTIKSLSSQSNSKTVIIDPLKGWIQSDPIIDRGSTFIGYARKVNSVDEAVEYLDLLVTDKKIAKAAHNISSWRIKKENGIQYQDCDDDGETAAGGRVLHLLSVRIIFLFHVSNV
ncbi:uncharacterized protein AC631_03153 [Debaryomyces fabryi]|uniref:RWD domain-containing protein n=1 Tax=Debaryomyces fabryi TaxID=58627 RepID=A0A0V1PXW3_9ASCO|nr:uncharacterized protein AC631_03153 [Debaryomyces fabryi]KSA01085.1 hypothetical protein AC631_03153 [Debaryomyces fabryi]